MIGRLALGASLIAILLASPAAAQDAPAPAQANPPAAETGPYRPHGVDEEGLWMEVEEYERDLKHSKLLIRDPDINAYLRRVLCKAVGDAKCAEARIYLVRNPYFNASMAPTGMMVVWSGLLLRMRNEAELAAVLGHEFAHYENRHSLKLFRDIRAKTDAMVWLSFVPFGQLAQIGLMGSIMAYNRDMEQESDLASIGYLAHAGFDPHAASQIWQQLRAEQDATAAARRHKSRKDKNGGFFATHPNTAKRMEYLAAAADAVVERSDDFGREAYRAALAPHWAMLVEDQVKLADHGGTAFLIEQLAQDGWTSDLLYAQAENLRLRGGRDDYALAARYYRSAIAHADALPENWRGLGLALIKDGQSDAGKTALARYLELRPDADDAALLAMMAGAST